MCSPVSLDSVRWTIGRFGRLFVIVFGFGAPETSFVFSGFVHNYIPRGCLAFLASPVDRGILCVCVLHLLLFSCSFRVIFIACGSRFQAASALMRSHLQCNFSFVSRVTLRTVTTFGCLCKIVRPPVASFTWCRCQN